MKQQIKAMEDEIYKTYYRIHPYGDARIRLWDQVMIAKRGENPIGDLRDILKLVRKGAL